MTQAYVMAYYIPLLLLWLFARAAYNKDYTFITNVSVVAFVVTRLITYLPEGDRIMLDFANDFVVCLSLIYLQRKNGILKKNRVVPFLILTYIAMMLSYILYISGVVENSIKTYMLEAISVVQLLLIFGGIIHGIGYSNIINNLQHSINNISYRFNMFRGIFNARYKKGMARQKNNIASEGGYSEPMEKIGKKVNSPTYGKTASNYWKPVK